MMRTLVTIPIRDEARRIDWLLDRLKSDRPADIDVLFVDDASTDGTRERIRAAGFGLVSHESRRGCGVSVRTGLIAGRDAGYDVLAVMAGNGKDDPALLRRLVDPIAAGSADFVQGSRYQPGGDHANMPLHRKIGTRGYSLAFSLLARRRMTDATNGFRALSRKILEDARIDLGQPWLEGDYEIETYLFIQSIRLGYRVREVAVSKRYPEQGPYTKMRPFAGWWSHFRPALLVATHLRK